jgi:hypothetical protein
MLMIVNISADRFLPLKKRDERSANLPVCKPIYTAVFKSGAVTFQCSSQSSSGNHWAVESEIFWKARGYYGLFAVAAIACVFKKLSEATARWYDAGGG